MLLPCQEVEHLTTFCSRLQVTQLLLNVTSRLNCFQSVFSTSLETQPQMYLILTSRS